MPVQKIDILDYLSGLTTFVFDKSVLKRVAVDNGVLEAASFADITEEQKDRCKIDLYEAIVFGPYQTASTTNQHGAFTQTVGAQILTSETLSAIKAELRRLYKKYNEEDKIETLNASDGEVRWINETD